MAATGRRRAAGSYAGASARALASTERNKGSVMHAEFMRMEPYLTGMARSLTGDSRLKVQLNGTGERSEKMTPTGRTVSVETKDLKVAPEIVPATSSTDGSTIYITPYASLGEPKTHNYRVCDIRDSRAQQICGECRRREELLGLFFHEIGHVIYESHAAHAYVSIPAPVARASWLTDEKRTKLRDALTRSDKAGTYMGLSKYCGLYFQLLFTTLDDIRIEHAMQEVRVNLADMMTARHMKYLEGDEEKYFAAKPLNLQIMVGLLIKAANSVDPALLFHEKIVADLDDSKLQALVTSLYAERTSTKTVFETTFAVYARLIELGYFEQPDSDEPDDEEEEGDDDGEEGSSGDGSPGSGKSSGKGGKGGKQPKKEETLDPFTADEPTEPTDPEDGDGDGDDGDGDGEPGDESGDGDGDGSSDSGDKGDADYRDTKGKPSEGGDGTPEAGDGSDGRRGKDSDGPGGDKGHSNAAPSGRPSMGSPADVEAEMEELLGHDHDGPGGTPKETELASVPALSEVHRLAFRPEELRDQPTSVAKVMRCELSADNRYWVDKKTKQQVHYADSIDFSNIKPSEGIFGRALMQLKLVFEKNARGAKDRNLKAGKINPSVLGKRAALGDDRLFQKKTLPGKRDYHVVLHVDISGSTHSGDILEFEKKAVFAQAELLARLGIKFTIIAGTGSGSYDRSAGDSKWMPIELEVKRLEDPWDRRAKERLAAIPSMSANLDGHALLISLYESMRSRATDRIVMYYSDGGMPMENYDEEKELITRAVATATKNNITLMAVGVRCDDPKKYGLDTVRIDRADDLSTVITHLAGRLGL